MLHVGAIRLLDTGLDDGWGSATVLDGTGRAAASLNGLDDALGGGIIVRDLAEDDVAAVEPAGDDGGDEELGAVAGIAMLVALCVVMRGGVAPTSR